MKRAISIILVLVMAFACLAGCGGKDSKNDLKDLVIGLAGEPTTLDPHAASLSSTNASVQGSIFGTLVEFDSSDNTFKPYMATSWEWIDDLTLEMKLREDLCSASGAKITADDVVFSLQRGGSNPALGNTYTYFDTANFVAVDDYTVHVKVHEVNTGAYGTLSLAPCAIVAREDVEKVGEEEFSKNPVATGPYKLESWNAGVDIKIVRNDKFWGEDPDFDSMTFKFIPDTNARSLALQSGDIHFAENLGAAMIPTLEGKEGITIHKSDICQMQIVWFNPDNEYLSNLTVRRALEYATNKEAIIAGVFNGVGTVATGIFTTSSQQYIAPEEDRSYNPEKAKELLAEAGYPDGFQITLMCYESLDYQNLLVMLQQQWAEVGVECEIETMDKGAYFTKLYAGEFDAYTIHMVGAEPMARVASCWSTVTREGGNLIKYANPEVDRLLGEANAETDEAKKNEIYKEMTTYFHEDCPYIPIAETYLISGSVDGITNVLGGQTSYILYYKLQIVE